jgi:hypothetical protein
LRQNFTKNIPKASSKLPLKSSLKATQKAPLKTHHNYLFLEFINLDYELTKALSKILKNSPKAPLKAL